MSEPQAQEAFTKNAADPKEVKEAGKKEKLAEHEKRRTILALLNTREGRWLYCRLLRRCGIRQLSFRKDPYETAFNEGERNIGLLLLDDVMTVAPAALDLMEKENPTNA